MERDWTVAPGETLQDWMDEQELSTQEMARRTGISLRRLRAIIAGVEPIVDFDAERLARETGMTVSLWLRLESMYREDLAAGRKRFEP